jgi:hypothetical protein
VVGRPRRAVFTAAHLATWLDRANVLGPLPAGIASIWETNMAVDTQVLVLTTTAEGLHRALHPEALRFTHEQSKTIQTAAVEAVREINADAADAVRGYLAHVYEVGYGTRLRDLAIRAEELVAGITGNPTRGRTSSTKPGTSTHISPLPNGWNKPASTQD